MNADTAREPRPRLAEIEALQDAREGRTLITYVTSTRSKLITPMAPDAIPVIAKHLTALELDPETSKIDLLLHTYGGDSTVPWRLMTLLREYASEVCLLVPHLCYSAGTLTALGADEVLMHPMGVLGPIDPAIGTPFNPRDDRTKHHLDIQVEDVSAYIDFVKQDVGITHEDELVQAFKILAEKVHPLALGTVKRSVSQSAMMGRKLLNSRQEKLDSHTLDEIVERLSTKLYYHGHPINRHEAHDDLNLDWVKPAPREIETVMWALFETYVTEMELDQDFEWLGAAISARQGGLPKPPKFDADKPKPAVATVNLSRLNTVFVESTARCDCRQLDAEATLTREWTGEVGIDVQLIDSRWRQVA
jgi:hypothetical protein